MRAVGVVAEYNPLHVGHLSQLREIKKRASSPGQDIPVVIALSGDFVQRGEAAVFSKFARAEAAVRCGASLVLELPLPWCLSSAEGFARGGIGILLSTGIVDAISFGSESGDLTAMRDCVSALKSPAYSDTLRQVLQCGISYASARRRAVAALAGEQTARVLDSPNDLLGVEYLRAVGEKGREIEFLPVIRSGSRHDGAGSASDIRRRMAEGEDWLLEIPPEAARVFRAEMDDGRGPVMPEDLRLPLLSRLREREKADFSAAPDVSEGLENPLWAAAMIETDPERIAAAAKSKRYALSRLRRAVLCTALGIRAGDACGTPPYLRVLAMDARGAELLADMRRSARVPVITKPAHVRREDAAVQRVFALGSRAHDLYVLGYKAEDQQRGGEDLRTGPYIHQKEEAAL